MTTLDYETTLIFILQETEYEISLYENIIMKNKYKSLKYLISIIVPMIVAMTIIYLFYFGLVDTPAIMVLFYITLWVILFEIIRCIMGWIHCKRNIKTCKYSIELLKIAITKPEFSRALSTIIKVTIDEKN